MVQELNTSQEQADTLSKQYNEILIENENLVRKAQTANKMVESLNKEKINIEYNNSKVIKEKEQWFSEQKSILEMSVEELYMRLHLSHNQIEGLEKVSCTT